jgi:hypothetical protein
MQDENKTQSESVAQTVRDELIKSNSAEIQAISQSLTSGTPREEPKRTIPEMIFREVFLAMFLGKPNERYPDIKPGNWITVAGSAHAAVDVIDDKHQVAFTVPPLMESQLIAPITGQLDVDMSYIADQAKLYQNSLPQVAENYLMEELTKRTSYMKSNADVSATMEAWKKILVYYGLLKAAETQASPSDKPSIDLDYEDVPP